MFVSSQNQDILDAIKRERGRHSAIRSVVGRINTVSHLGRNYFKVAMATRMVRCAADVKAKRAKLEGRGIAGKTAIVGAKDRATKTDFPFGSAAFSWSESCSGPRERPAVRSVVLSFLSISGQLDPV